MRSAKPLNNSINRHIRRKVRRRTFQHGRANGSRTDGIDANAIGRVIQRESSSQAKKAALRSGISDNPGLASMALHGGDDHDGSPAAFFHFRDAEVRKEIRAAKIHSDTPIPGFRVRFDGIPERMNCGRICDEIEATELRDGFGYDCLHLIGPANVTHFNAKRKTLNVGFMLEFAVRRCIDAAGHDAGTARRESDRDAASNPGGTGDDGYLVFEVIHESQFSWFYTTQFQVRETVRKISTDETSFRD
jgi:hypothetical protein